MFRNLTDYSDLFIRNLIEQANGNPYRCTANVQYAVEGNHLTPVLVIYQDDSKGWDLNDAVLFLESTEAVDFCDGFIPIDDFNPMVKYYRDVEFQKCVNDIEYEEEMWERERKMEEWLLEELAWYNHARQMGWE